MTAEAYIYIGIAVFLAVIITYALTKQFAVPEIKVIDVVTRHTVELKTFQYDFLIDEYDLRMRGIPIAQMEDRLIREAIHTLIREIPIEMYEIRSRQQYGQCNMETVYTVSIQIMPPLKHKHEIPGRHRH